MQLSNSPGKLVLPFAASGNKNAIPVNSQIGITPGAASLADGFPPLTMTPIAAGGVPPSGLDMNGILYDISNVIRWANAGGGYSYDAAFATSTYVAGYPKGARVLRADGTGYWFNTVDGNETDPDGSTPIGWVPDFTTGAATVAMTSANVTLTPIQYGKQIVIITGMLTANLNLIFPEIVTTWLIINKTTGNFDITAKTTSTVGFIVPQNTVMPAVFDGALFSTGDSIFKQLDSGAIVTDIQRRGRLMLNVMDFIPRNLWSAIANGSNTVDLTSYISTAISAAYARTLAPRLLFPAGFFKVTGPLTNLTGPIEIEGESQRSTQIMCSGSSNIFNVAGSGTRAVNVNFSNIGLNGNAMTGGYLVAIDWAQDTTFENVAFIDPYQAVSIRQAGNTRFKNVIVDKVRGPKGIYAFANNTTRNGENDQIDIISFYDTLLQSNYVAGGAIPVSELLYIDGRVHTIGFFGLRLLNALRGMVCKNSPALAANFVPRFFMGSDLEVENMYAETQRLDYAVDYFVDSIFGAGSYSADGIYLGAGVGNFNPGSGSVNSNSLCGINIDGAVGVNINEMSVYNNSLVGSGVKPGIQIAAASKAVAVRGGLAGKAYWLPAYTENQKYGIEINSNGLVQIDNVDTRGNATGSIYPGGSPINGSYVKSCPGFNPTSAHLQTVGASPYTYTSGLAQEAITLYGGTGVVVTVDGVVLTNTTPASFVLPPKKSAVISYVTAPTMAVNGM